MRGGDEAADALRRCAGVRQGNAKMGDMNPDMRVDLSETSGNLPIFAVRKRPRRILFYSKRVRKLNAATVSSDYQ